MTNYEKIKSLSIEEMSEFIQKCELSDIDYAMTFCDMCNNNNDCEVCLKEWLNSDCDDWNGINKQL